MKAVSSIFGRISSGHILGLATIMFLMAGQSAFAQDLKSLLKRGPVVLVETNSKGRFHSATAVISVKAGTDVLWKHVIAFAKYKDFMPNMEQSDVKQVSPTSFDVTYEIEVPGPNPDYTFRYVIQPENLIASGRWVKGDLKNSFCKWRLVSVSPTESLIYYTAASRNFSRLAQSLEDKQQTITVGVNVSAALAAVKAMKSRAEGK